MQGELLIACGDRACLRQATDRVLDHVPGPIGRGVETGLASGAMRALAQLVGAPGGDGAHMLPVQPAANHRIAVARVPGQLRGARALPPRCNPPNWQGSQYVEPVLRPVRAARAQGDSQEEPLPSSDEMERGREPTAVLVGLGDEGINPESLGELLRSEAAVVPLFCTDGLREAD